MKKKNIQRKTRRKKVSLPSLFKKRVLSVVRGIKRGQALSYGEVARRAGNPGAARAVGTIMSLNHDPKIPCHRVVRADGSLGGYNRGLQTKEKLLKKEGALKYLWGSTSRRSIK